MGAIFRVNEHDLPWVEYRESADEDGDVRIRVKALTLGTKDVPPVQFVEYAAGHTDPVHSHTTDEFDIYELDDEDLAQVAGGTATTIVVTETSDGSLGG